MPCLPDSVCVSPGSIFVALAAVTLPDALDLHACLSCAHLCYFQVERSIDDDLHHVRIAALPHRLHDVAGGNHSEFMYLTASQLAQALPWDRTLQGMITSDVRALLECHSAQMSDVPMAPPIIAPHIPAEPSISTVHVSRQDLQHALETMHRSPEDVLASAAQVRRSGKHQLQRWLDVVLFRAVLSTLAQRTVLHQMIQRVLRSRRQFPQRLISACEVYKDGLLQGWLVQVTIPGTLAAAT